MEITYTDDKGESVEIINHYIRDSYRALSDVFEDGFR
mgnify:CR=1 FL=1